MKKNLLNFFMLMAVAAMPLTSCEKDPQKEDGQHDPESDADQKEIVAYDALSYLQGSLVVVNKEGELIRRVYGKALDASYPTVISVPVADFEAAKKIFLGWVAPGKDVDEVDEGFDYMLTDKEGKSQGSVSFREVDDEPGVVARMYVEEGTVLKQISEVNFIDYDLWPENAAYQKVEYRKIYYLDDYVLTWPNRFKAELKSLPFYCLQGNTDGNEGILVWLSPDLDGSEYHSAAINYMNFALPYLPTESQAQKALDRLNENRLYMNLMLQDMKANGHDWYADTDITKCTTGNYEFIIGQYDEDWLFDDIMCVDLDGFPGSMQWVSSISFFNYRYMHVEIIPPVK